ncbi:MAG: hypothetical protein E6H66_21400 [Betaproteobacteria bacterium]|nr:MAG: hypothetical protein E6H66_21400 [Betaproteobacteria bacterium]
MSILTIFIIASDARLALARSGSAIISPRTVGTICHERRSYVPLPVRKKEIPKDEGKKVRVLIDWRPRIFVTVDEGEALVEAARAGVGITQVPSYMADEAIKRNEVVEVLPDIRPPPNPISAIYASQRNLPARIRAFIDFLTTLPRPHYAPEPRPASSRARRAMGTAQR